jgi:hypothetical protein
MTNHEDLILLFTGSEINANILKEILNDNQIGCLVKNEMRSGLTAGFGGGYLEAEASLYVTNEHFERAKVLLDEFLKSFDSE